MRIRLLSAICLWVLCIWQPVFAFDLTILHVNDSHSYLDSTEDRLTPDGEPTYVQLGAWARLASAVGHVRQEGGNVALLHAGDAVQGGLYFMKYDGRPEMEFLNRLAFDAYTLGNHEFDKGSEFLAGFLGYVHVPVLGANVSAPGVPGLAAKLSPYTILTYGEEKVGVIGLTLEETRFVSSPGPGVNFADEAETAKIYVAELEKLGVNKIILLTHVGLENDKKLAAEVPGVDVIVGGHSHSLLIDPVAMNSLGRKADAPYPVVVKGVEGHDVYVVTAWKWGRVLGRIGISFDEEGKVVSVDGRPVLLVADGFKRTDQAGEKVILKGEPRQQVLDAFEENPVTAVVAENAAAAEFLKPFSEGVQSLRKEIVGKAVKNLSHIRVPGTTESGLRLPHGSLIAPLVARSMLAKVDATGESADLALQNAGGVRHSIDKGGISVGMAYTLLPFANTLYILEVPGKQVKDALEYGVSRGGGAFPYVAGARYSADMNRPDGERITSLELHEADGTWQPYDPDRVYRLVTNAYLARGGDGYAMLKEVKSRYDTGFVDAQAFIEYVEKVGRVLPPEDTGVSYIPAK